MSVQQIFASHLIRLMGWADLSTLDLYGRDAQTEPATRGQASPREDVLVAAGQLRGVVARGGSGDEQTQAQLRRVEGDEFVVTLGPPA